MSCELAHRGEEIVHRHSSGACSGRARKLGAVDRVDVAVDHDGLAMLHTRERAVDRLRYSVAADLGHRHDEIARSERVLVHLAAVGEAGEAHLRDVRSGQAILDQRTHRVAVAEALIEVAHVEMGVERDQPDLVEWHSQAEHAGPRHRVVAADQQGELVRSRAGADRLSDRRGRLLDRESAKLYVAMVRDLGRELSSGLDIVAADPAQGRTQQLRRQVAPARRHRTYRERRSDQPDRCARIGGDEKLGKVRPAAHLLTLTAALA